MVPTSLSSWSPRHHVGRNFMRSTVATRVVLAGSNSCGAPANVVIGELGSESIAVGPQENRRSHRSTRVSRAMYEKLQSSPIVTMDEIEAIELSNPLPNLHSPSRQPPSRSPLAPGQFAGSDRLLHAWQVSEMEPMMSCTARSLPTLQVPGEHGQNIRLAKEAGRKVVMKVGM